jgi:hypothetical protein
LTLKIKNTSFLRLPLLKIKKIKDEKSENLKMFQILEDGDAIAPEESLEGRTRVVLLLLPAHPLSIPTKLRFT